MYKKISEAHLKQLWMREWKVLNFIIAFGNPSDPTDELEAFDPWQEFRTELFYEFGTNNYYIDTDET